MGHVRDLPKSQMGVDVDNQYAPKYITVRGKGKVLKELKAEANKAKTFTWLLTLIGKAKPLPGIWPML